MLESLIYNDDCEYVNYAMYSTELSFINAVLSALRPVSREQVEKVWRGRWQRGTKDWVCSRCGRSHTFVKSFCPNCGAPMTDEAVQMVMERLEALHDNRT